MLVHGWKTTGTCFWCFGRNGPNNPARVLVLAANWLASPKNARRSVRLVGVGNWAMVSMIEWSTAYPSDDIWNPANTVLGWAYSHLIQCNLMFGTPLKELMDVLSVLGFVAFIDDDIICNSSVSCQSWKGFIHPPVVVF